MAAARRRTFESQCQGKHGWRQRAAAKRAARQTETRLGGGHLVHYRCPHCGRWHVGHARRTP